MVWGEGQISVVQRRNGTPRWGWRERPGDTREELGEASVGYLKRDLHRGAALVCPGPAQPGLFLVLEDLVGIQLNTSELGGPRIHLLILELRPRETK